jgi:hypothetical protein
MSNTIERLMQQVTEAVGDYVSRALAPVLARLKQLESRAPEKGEKGDQGDRGADGLNGEHGKDGVDGQSGRDGIDGKNGADGLNGKDGADGRDGLKGADGANGMHGKDGADGIDGKDGVGIRSVEVGEKSFDLVFDNDTRVEVPLPEGPHGEQGLRGEKGDPGLNGKDGANGLHGKDGSDGRDALDIDILPSIDVARRYPRGTFAHWQNGVIRSIRNTEPIGEGPIEKAGWHVVMCGVSELSFELDENMRDIKLAYALTGSPRVEKAIRVPTMIYRNVWRPGEYLMGDTATRDGSTFVCVVEKTQAIPGQSEDWVLSVKRGRDGKDGLKGEKGERGSTGRAGKDLTQMGPDGSKF